MFESYDHSEREENMVSCSLCDMLTNHEHFKYLHLKAHNFDPKQRWLVKAKTVDELLESLK